MKHTKQGYKDTIEFYMMRSRSCDSAQDSFEYLSSARDVLKDALINAPLLCNWADYIVSIAKYWELAMFQGVLEDYITDNPCEYNGTFPFDDDDMAYIEEHYPVDPYSDMVNNAVLQATVSDGYNGHTQEVKLTYHNGVWYEIAKCGFYKANRPWNHYTNLRPV